MCDTIVCHIKKVKVPQKNPLGIRRAYVANDVILNRRVAVSKTKNMQDVQEAFKCIVEMDDPTLQSQIKAVGMEFV